MSSFPETIKAIAIDKTGDINDVLEVKTLPFPAPTPGNVIIKVAYCGINFIDTYYRHGDSARACDAKGLYPIQSFPQILGMEASGTVVALPPDAASLQTESAEFQKRGLQVGSRVAVNFLGVHAEYASVPWPKVFPLPAAVSLRTAAAATLQGLTALAFVEEAHPVRAGDRVFVHTVAGGFGLLVAQLAKRAGAALVLGTTSSAAKAAAARAAGADHVILYNREDVVARALALTGGEGVDVVYDGVGKDTFLDNFKILRRKGSLISVGNASGAVEPIAPLKLVEKNLKLMRGAVLRREAIRHHPKDELKINIYKEYPFTTEGARQAQTDLTTKGGSTVGKLLYKISDE
ncbi:NAD-P-binding protein [Epithele typhae]|uniref:NAD-P-binding protein n=1 Tax=Epithele typhae TaxID=378194 RepID=UPI00200899A3|nr:NAD-P-binding protein [Epithele typhae]KAH9932066.1 NAD-P-binding protein [Epithele typhae]